MKTDADCYVDSDVIIRFLTGDDLKKQKASAALFEHVAQGKKTLVAPDTVIADVVFVLSSPRLYRFPRPQTREILTTLLRMANFKVENKHMLIRTLDIYATTTIDFGDAFLAALAIQSRGEGFLYSYDHDFDTITGVTRREP